MSFYLVTFSRGEDANSVVEAFEDAEEAMAQFVAAERAHRERQDGKGVVLLIADDEETLRRTHSHYFVPTDQLLDAVRAKS
jgi:protein-disulfide isomerase-like protein with CxxC motif